MQPNELPETTSWEMVLNYIIKHPRDVVALRAIKRAIEAILEIQELNAEIKHCEAT